VAVVIANRPENAVGMVGIDSGAGPFIFANGEWDPGSVDKRIFVAQRSVIVTGITARVTVAGTDGGAVSLQIRKVPNGTTITAGTLLHTSSVDLKGSANVNQVLSLSSTVSDLILDAGDSLALDFTGVLTSATGGVTVSMCPR